MTQINKEFPDPVTEIIRIVSQEYNINIPRILGRQRKSSIKLARHIAMHFCILCKMGTYEEIGTYFDRDHGTVIYADRKIRDLIAIEPQYHLKAYSLCRQKIEEKLALSVPKIEEVTGQGMRTAELIHWLKQGENFKQLDFDKLTHKEIREIFNLLHELEGNIFTILRSKFPPTPSLP